MNLAEIGSLVRQRREALGLTQSRLAKLAGLSRATIHQLEAGTLVDLGVVKLAVVVELLGLQLEAMPHRPSGRGLVLAARTASVSYKTSVSAVQLADALATGELPAAWLPHMATLLDESPLPLIVRAVEDAAARGDVPPKRIWRHLTHWARELHSPRPAWA